MNNRMSYNDVEQLKNQIRVRLGSAANDVMKMANGVARGAGYSAARPQNQSLQGGRQTAPRQGINPQMTSQQGINPQMLSQQRMNSTMKSSMTPPEPMKSSMTPPKPMKSPDMRPQPMVGGAHFDKYDCGHKYPKISMQQHIKSELDKDSQRRAENLQYAVVMSEVLGEPVSRKRRRKRSAV